MNLTVVDPRLLQVLIGATLKATVLLGFVAVAALVWRSAAARSRQLLWAMGLIGAAVLPLVSPVVSPLLPDLQLPLLAWPARSSNAESRPLHEVKNLSPHPEVTPAADFVADRPTTWTAPPDSKQAGAWLSPPPSQNHWPALLGGLWLCGFLLLLTRWCVGQWGAIRLARRSQPVTDPAWQDLLRQCQRQVGLRRSVSLRTHSTASTPMTWGLLRPIVLLPTSAQSWCPERRRVVLLHELLHVYRGDWLLRGAAQLASAFYWFHPLVWLGLRRLTVEQERACDDGVLALGTAPSRYADHLLAIACGAVYSPIPLPAVEMAGRSSMETRLMSILSFPRRAAQARRPIFAVILLTAALIPALAAVQIWAVTETPAPEAPVAPDAPVVPEIPVAPTAPVAVVAPEAPAFAPMPGLTPTPRPERAPRVMPTPGPMPNPALAPTPASPPTPVVAPTPAQRPMASPTPPTPMPAPDPTPLAAPAPPSTPQPAPAPRADSNLAAVVAELQALEQRLRPFEEKLEDLATQLEPLETLGSKTSERSRPYERKLETIEERLRPYREQIEAAARELQPLETQMEELSSLMHPYEELVSQVQLAVRPNTEGLDQLLAQLEPYHRQLAEHAQALAMQGAELEGLHRQHREARQHANAAATAELERAHRSQVEQLNREMEEQNQKMQAVHLDMEPFNRKMQALAQQMRPSQEEMEALRKKLEPLRKKMEALRLEMEPALQKINLNSEGMEALHREMEKIHLNMEPLHRDMEKMHLKLQPVHEEMQRLHEQMEPLHREMEGVHKKLQHEVRGNIRAILNDEFSGLHIGSQALDQATARIMEEISFHKSDSRLSVRAPAARLRRELSAALDGASSNSQVKAGIERAARAISSLEILY